LVSPHRRSTDVPGLAPSDRVVECPDGFLDRRVVVVAVGLVDVDCVHPQAVEAIVEFLFDRFPREPPRVGVVVVHLEVTLRGDDRLVASPF
jgi:hypothetical protein